MNIMYVIGSTLYINYIENANSSREAKERKGQRLLSTRCVPLTFYDNSQHVRIQKISRLEEFWGMIMFAGVGGGESEEIWRLFYLV